MRGYGITGEHLVRLWAVVRAASVAFNVLPESVTGKARTAPCATARQAVIHKCHGEGMAGMELAVALKRSHTTIYSANARAQALLDTDPDFRARYERMLELLESSGDGMTREPSITRIK